MVVYVKYKITSNMLRGHNTIYHRLSFYCAIFSMFCGVGVASYQHHNARGTHNLFAVNFFVWGVIHICMECFLEWKCKLEPNKKLTQLRIFLAVVTCVRIYLFISLEIISNLVVKISIDKCCNFCLGSLSWSHTYC